MRIGSSCALLLALVLSGCGEKEDSAGVAAPADASTESCSAISTPTEGAACSPSLSSCWAPVWKPPHAPRSACTESQIDDDMSKCWGADYDPDCEVFERDPANADCLSCLFSIEEDASYGPLILLANGSIQTNIPGCMALVDGDASAMGCGAKYQAYYDCIEAACGSNCPTYDDYVTCSSTARIGVCAHLLEQAVCRRRPEYASCNAYTTFEEYFFAIAKKFCSPGSDGGAAIDAGPKEADADDASVADAGDSGDAAQGEAGDGDP